MGWLPDRPGSGVDRVYHALAHYLPQVDVEVQGVVISSDRTHEMLSRDPEIHAAAAASDALFRRLWRMRQVTSRVIAATNPDVIAAHFALYALPIVSIPDAPPLVVHFHGPWALESKAEGEHALVTHLKAQLERLVYRHATQFIVLSQAFKETLVEAYEVPSSRVRIVPGGVDLDRFNPAHTKHEARNHLEWPTDRPIIFSVRRLVRRVGLEQLIEAMDAIRDQVPEALLLIAGKGPQAHHLRQLIAARNLSDTIRLLGFVSDDDLPIAYRAADFSVVPTVALEGFGLVAVESLAAGTPVLVTPVGGLPEVVADLSRELIMDGSSARDLARHIEAALDGALDLPSPTACRSFATRRYDWSTVAQQVRAVYEEVLQ